MRPRIVALAFLMLAAPLLAEQHPNVERGFQADKVYQFGTVDNVNLFNGNLTLTIPIGNEYAGNGALRYRFTLVYNSKAWDYERYIYDDFSHCNQDPGSDLPPVDPACGNPYTLTMPSRSSNAGMGWSLTLGRLMSPNDPALQGGSASQNGAPWTYEGPDGAQHAFNAFGLTLSGPVYTQDGSFLRLQSLDGIYQVEFPDGTIQKFGAGPNNTLRLLTMADRFGNHLDAAYDDVLHTWTFKEYAGSDPSTVIRQHVVKFGDRTNVTPPPGTTKKIDAPANYNFVVSEIDLAAFNGATAVYTLDYSDHNDGIYYGCYGDYRYNQTPSPSDPNAYVVPRLHHVFLPDGSKWDADYTNMVCSEINQLVVPTRGTMQWSFTGYSLPTNGCTTFQVPGNYTDESSFETVNGVATKSVIANGQTSNWTYTHSTSLPAQMPCPNGQSFTQKNQQATTTVLGPDLHKTENYFSVWNSDATWNGNPSGASLFDRREYGLPFTRGAGSGCDHSPIASDRCLSSREFDCSGPNCILLRVHEVRYEADSGESTVGFTGFGYRREVASRTKFCENPSETDCTTNNSVNVARSRYDGMGHYRQTVTADTWGDLSQTETTLYNQSKPDVTTDALTWASSPSPSSNFPAVTDPWLLNLFTESTVTAANGTSARSEFCFDPANGFLNRKRLLASMAEATKDLLAVFDHDSNGNLTKERYAGGDQTPLASGFSTCSGSVGDPPAGGFMMTHEYAWSAMKSTQYPGVPYKSLDLTIDRNTGLPSASADTAGMTTTYLYDSQGRLLEERPNALAWTEYVYSPTATPPSVSVKQRPAGTSSFATPLTERSLFYDELGRLAETRTRMPDSAGNTPQWSVTRTNHDVFGRTTATSMPEYRGGGTYETAFNPAHWQSFTYDVFGRTLSSTTPDNKLTTMSYTGIRETKRSQTVHTTNDAVTTEVYDGLGRLLGVSEPGGNSGTSYGYDASGHLFSVTMTGGSPSVVQSRSFNYDGRGLMTSETHPEVGTNGNGSIFYNYDGRGHVTKKLVGGGSGASGFDLAYIYDSAEHLTGVDEITNRTTLTTRPLKRFTFATANDGNALPTNYTAGKLSTAVRYNYPSMLDLSTATPGTFIATEIFHYQDQAGMLTGKDTLVEHDTGTLPRTTMMQTTQAYAYDALGHMQYLSYPQCLGVTCGGGSPIAGALFHAYSQGHLQAVGSYGTSFTYHPTGAVASLKYGQNGGVDVTDTSDADPNGMARPARIAFSGFDDCAPATPSINAASRVCPSSTGNAASIATVTGATYLWQIAGGTITSGATTAAIQYTAGSSGTVTLTVTVTTCAARSTSIQVPIGAPTAQITSGNATIAPGQSTTIQATLTGTPPWSVTWSTGATQTYSASPATLTVSPATTTTYSITAVSDNTCSGTVLGGPVTITVMGTPANFFTWKNGNNSKTVWMQWNTVTGATSYTIERTSRLQGPQTIWQVVTPSFCQTVGGAQQCTDAFTQSVPSPTGYVYRVKAVSNSVVSAASNMDYAAVADQLFQDEPLAAGSTLIRGRHVSDLRAGIDAVRWAAGLTLKWSTYPPQTGPILAAQIYDPAFANNLPAATDLRNVLDEAVLAVRGVRLSYTTPAPAPGGRVFAYQVEEIRTGVK